MVWTVEWQGGFVTGGEGARRLTPSFRLREFRQPDGTVRVHRELVAGLQLLRDRFGHPLSVRRTDEDGLGATVAADPAAGLMDAALSLLARSSAFSSLARSFIAAFSSALNPLDSCAAFFVVLLPGFMRISLSLLGDYDLFLSFYFNVERGEAEMTERGSSNQILIMPHWNGNGHKTTDI